MTPHHRANRMEAEIEGRVTFRGDPCRHGHRGRRYTISGACVVCRTMINAVSNAARRATAEKERAHAR